MSTATDPGSFAGIQYMRSVAAMMVVFHHAPRSSLDWLAGTDFGARGVEIFFVISGFIMAHTTRNFREGQLRQVLGFLKKRLIRVAPLYWIALSYMAIPMLLNRGPNLDLLKDYLFIPHYSERYPGHIYPLLVPGWSLNYEMFFYVVFGLGIFLRRWKLAFVLTALAGLFLAGLALEPVSAAAVFYTAADVLYFAVGVVVYWVHLGTKGVQWSLRVGLAVTLLSLFLLGLDSPVPGVLTHGIAAALIVYAAVVSFGRFRSPALGTLGDASYSIYLFHAPALPLAAWLASSAGLAQHGVVGALAVVLVYLIVGAAVGTLLHFVLERPLLAWLTGMCARPAIPDGASRPKGAAGQ